MGTFLLVCICGGLGAVARFMLNTSIQRWWHRAYPLSTFIINIIAAICAGTAAAAYFYQTVNYSTYLLFVAGFGWFLHVLHGDQRDGVAHSHASARGGRFLLPHHARRAVLRRGAGVVLRLDRALIHEYCSVPNRATSGS